MVLSIFARNTHKKSTKSTDDVELGQMTQQSGIAENLVNEEQVALMDNSSNEQKEGIVQMEEAFVTRNASNNAIAVENRNNIGTWTEMSCVKKMVALCAILGVLITAAFSLFSGGFNLFSYLQYSKDESFWETIWFGVMMLDFLAGFIVSGAIVFLLWQLCRIWKHRND